MKKESRIVIYIFSKNFCGTIQITLKIIINKQKNIFTNIPKCKVKVNCNLLEETSSQNYLWAPEEDEPACCRLTVEQGSGLMCTTELLDEGSFPSTPLYKGASRGSLGSSHISATSFIWLNFLYLLNKKKTQSEDKSSLALESMVLSFTLFYLFVKKHFWEKCCQWKVRDAIKDEKEG